MSDPEKVVQKQPFSPRVWEQLAPGRTSRILELRPLYLKLCSVRPRTGYYKIECYTSPTSPREARQPRMQCSGPRRHHGCRKPRYACLLIACCCSCLLLVACDPPIFVCHEIPKFWNTKSARGHIEQRDSRKKRTAQETQARWIAHFYRVTSRF